MTNRLVVDCVTNETTIVPLTEEEIAQIEKDRIEAEKREIARKAEAEAKAEAKASALAKLAALGLTEEEANAIAGA